MPNGELCFKLDGLTDAQLDRLTKIVDTSSGSELVNRLVATTTEFHSFNGMRIQGVRVDGLAGMSTGKQIAGFLFNKLHLNRLPFFRNYKMGLKLIHRNLSNIEIDHGEFLNVNCTGSRTDNWITKDSRIAANMQRTQGRGMTSSGCNWRGSDFARSEQYDWNVGLDDNNGGNFFNSIYELYEAEESLVELVIWGKGAKLSRRIRNFTFDEETKPFPDPKAGDDGAITLDHLGTLVRYLRSCSTPVVYFKSLRMDPRDLKKQDLINAVRDSGLATIETKMGGFKWMRKMLNQEATFFLVPRLDDKGDVEGVLLFNSSKGSHGYWFEYVRDKTTGKMTLLERSGKTPVKSVFGTSGDDLLPSGTFGTSDALMKKMRDFILFSDAELKAGL